ncbi:hypothetical protein SBOR_3389 [Sclerotinia borealis F-4128]|uniref:Adenosine deaminase domain-containing protein n=1 Tax=Sclerotinia borealis (strain F-4128) TaxID=1432307 RepID=W9CK39_SCLBF|nr:hypothetical protein SBOR_3389 [Sclerotinia borealis F-4128]
MRTTCIAEDKEEQAHWNDITQSTTEIPITMASPARLEEFANNRAKLVADEKEYRGDHEFVKSLTPTAQAASKIVSRIQDFNRRFLFDTGRMKQMPPEFGFLFIKEDIAGTAIFEIVKKLPKACASIDFIIDKMMETPGMYISATRPLDSPWAQKEKKIKLKFVYSTAQPRLTRSAVKTMWDTDYEPESLVPVSLAASTYSTYGPTDKDWQNPSRPGVHHQSGKTAFATWLRSRLIAQRAQRSIVSGGMGDTGGERKVCKHDEKKRERMVGLRNIWTGLRYWKDEDIKADMENCMRVKEIYPDLISGYDIVGQEELGRTLEDVTPIMLWFKKQCELRNLKISFFLHAGERLGDGDVNDDNLCDAILLGARRISHGYSLPKHPLLEELYQKHRIMVESCPMSNDSLRTIRSASAHTVPMLLAKGVGASLNCHDLQLLGQEMSGVSMKFFMAIWGWNLSLGGLGHLAQNSVRWSQFEDQNDEDWQLGIQEGESSQDGLKGKRMREWKNSWEEFCAWIVESYDKSFGNEAAYQTLLKEREDLKKKQKEEEEREEREWLEKVDELAKNRTERRAEVREKERRRRKVLQRAKELIAEEKLQKNLDKDQKQ